MVTIYDLKPKFQQTIMPIVKFCKRRGITPNQVTIFTCILSIIVGVMLMLLHEHQWFYIIIPLFMFIRMALNAVDGVLASRYNQKTLLGKYLNELTDVVSDAGLYLPFMLVVVKFPMIVPIFVILAVISEMAGVIGEVIHERRYDGPMGKSDRAFVIGLVSFLIFIGIPIIPILHYIFLICAILIMFNIYKRVQNGLGGRR